MALHHLRDALAPSAPAVSGAAHHVAVVIHDFSTGGTERVAIRLANAWSKSRRVTIFCGNEDGPTRALVEAGVQVVPVAPRMQRGESGRREFGHAVAGMVLGMRPDVVVGPGNYHVPVLRAMAACLGARRPAIVCKLSNPLWRHERRRLAQAAFAWRFRDMTAGFDRLVAMSPSLAAEAAVTLRRHDLACVGEPVLDDDHALPLARRATGMVLCVGRLAHQKNFGLALEAFARAQRPERLLILGEGEQYPELRDHAERLGIADRVRFTGFVRDTGPYLRAADALLCSSIYEGYPAALIEALANGTPVVTTPCSMALPEMLADPSFGIVAAADPEALALALDRVLEQGRSPERGPLRELVRRHRLGQSAEQWLEVLDAAAAGRARVWSPPVNRILADERANEVRQLSA